MHEGLSEDKALAPAERRWIICQIGAREHYVLAAELFARGRLAALVTDAWASPGSLLHRLAVASGAAGNRVLERYSAAMRGACVCSEGTVSLLLQDLRSKVVARARSHWTGLMSTNEWFGARMACRLERSGVLHDDIHGPPVVFAYSYAAREIFRTARRAGCFTVLGQIDPGPTEFEVVAEVARRHGITLRDSDQPPAAYWENWREECALADLILVNSRWSANALTRAGIDQSKVLVAPLAYRTEAGIEPLPSTRWYPAKFTSSRPLKLLFLGQINLRKGALELLQAMARLAGAPVHLTMVGPVQNDLRARFACLPQVEWIGSVARSEVAAYYRDADVFILPTHSDGFALTQLEAQAFRLPVFASQWCGDVVTDGVNGRLIDPITPEAIAELVERAIAHPEALQEMSVHAVQRVADFSPAYVVDELVKAVSSLAL
jgi:glycosyltransferase involved in cell wall biosynthesis